MTRGPGRLWLAGMWAALALSSPLRGQEQPAPPPAQLPDQQVAETLDYGVDASTRMTVPVNIGTHGPYQFIVDTGSERTVISSELARTLALGPGPHVIVHSMTEVSEIPTVVLPGLRVGQRTMEDIEAPFFSRRNLGAHGILGVDTLQTQRVIFDFHRQEMTIVPSRRVDPRWPPGEIVVTARSRFGRLMLIDAEVDGQRVYVIVDTGGQITVGNNALRRALERRHRLGAMATVNVLSVTGGEFTAEYTLARHIRIGGANIVNLPIAFADVHPFEQLELMDRPAILLGMDALRLFDRVSVDFANRRVRLLLPDSSENGAAVRIAGGAATLIGH
ncbi:MAG TPA: retroviral-like aspartic protease family protein [Allosphingosinicella sp.]|nr:retroviral-like aspartic protease family protein [Allosphingosinicella sp.]